MKKIGKILGLLSALLVFSSPLMAQGGAVAPTVDSGNTAWILVATIFVLMMTIPGLALFYGGLVRQKNVLSILMQCIALVEIGRAHV